MYCDRRPQYLADLIVDLRDEYAMRSEQELPQLSGADPSSDAMRAI